MSIKKDIDYLCMRIAMRKGVKCEAYFSNVHYTGCKVSILFGHDIHKFKSYKDAMHFLTSIYITITS